LRRYRYTLAALGLGLVLITMIFGVDPNGSGARLWLGFAGLYFQPSELLKILLVIFFAAYLDDYRDLLVHSGARFGPLRLPPLPYLAPILLMFGLSQLVLFVQRDLGAAMLFFGIFIGMLYVASGRLSYVAAGGLLFLIGVWIAYLLFSHVRLRVAIWLDPWPQAETGGYQLVQALMALGAGGVLGSGLGQGYPGYIPAVHTDFIIAAIGEELGLAGSLGVVALYMLFVARGFHVALRATDPFVSLLAAGLTTVVGLQALVILGGTLRLMPLTGITLPLVSYGGSSVLANFILLGLLLRVSAERPGASSARQHP
jgi:cell division protein FtsW (lipid II flippase)